MGPGMSLVVVLIFKVRTIEKKEKIKVPKKTKERKS